MAAHTSILLSVVVPLYNESAGFETFHDSLLAVLRQTALTYEIIYVNDGSTDSTLKKLTQTAKNNPTVRVLSLTRNFGKEIATTAGIHAAQGRATITLDADGQHPVELIPSFIAHWQAGAKVVIGIRTANNKEGFVKRYGSKLFYGLFGKLMGIKLQPGLSDYRIIDRSVQQQFVRMTERNRITPLYITAYIGGVILPVSLLIGLGMLVNFVIGDPFGLDVTAGAYVLVLILFLVGVLLVSQGIIGLYLSHIHTETQNRPLYVVDTERSFRIDESEN
jgi:glycosyltransferase involved in cell wall biosynthesis